MFLLKPFVRIWQPINLRPCCYFHQHGENQPANVVGKNTQQRRKKKPPATANGFSNIL
jgi:hypothetical protein